MTSLDRTFEGLRSHDIHQGLSAARIDRSSGVLARELYATQLIGMAGAVSSWIKGHDVIPDADALRALAADQLDVDPLAFDNVVGLLEDLAFVSDVRREHRRVKSFSENVPLDFGRMYDALGSSWRDQGPTEVEGSLIETVDALAHGPLLVSELPVDPDALPSILTIGKDAEAIQEIEIGGEQIVYSPFFSYERPEAMRDALTTVDVETIQEAVNAVRNYQGVPVSVSPLGETFTRLVASGLMAGPSVQRPDRSLETFVVAPYGWPADLLSVRRPLLDKALAVVAAVRMGQHFGGITSLHSPVLILDALLDPDRVVARHSSTTRQYAVLNQLGIVRFVDIQGRYGIKLVESEDNQEAVKIARDLLTIGEAGTTKEPRSGYGALLVQGIYRSPIQAIREAKGSLQLSADDLRDVVEAIMDRRAP